MSSIPPPRPTATPIARPGIDRHHGVGAVLTDDVDGRRRALQRNLADMGLEGANAAFAGTPVACATGITCVAVGLWKLGAASVRYVRAGGEDDGNRQAARLAFSGCKSLVAGFAAQAPVFGTIVNVALAGLDGFDVVRSLAPKTAHEKGTSQGVSSRHGINS